MRTNRHRALLATALLMSMGGGAAILPAQTSAAPRRFRDPAEELADARAREIAEHNAKVDRRRAERLVQRAQRKALKNKTPTP